MRILAVLLIIVVMVILCLVTIKIAYWMEKVDKKIDKKLYGFETDDYKLNRQIRVDTIIIFFVVATIGLIVLCFKQ